MSLSIYGNTIKSLMQDGKEIIKIERVEDGKILYEKKENDLLFYDDASIDKSSNYQTTLIQTSGTISLSHNTDKYVLNNSNNHTKAVKFLSDIPTDCIIEVDHNSGDNNIGVALMDNSNNKNAMCFNTYHTGYGAWKYSNGSWSDWYSGSYSPNSSNEWVHVKLIKQGTNLKIQYYTQNDVLLATKEIIATTYSKYDVGICIGNTKTAYFKNIKVRTLSPYNLSVTASEDIIQSGDATTLTATLTDNNVPVTGKRLNYQIKHDNMVISSGSDTTDNNGQISFNYTGEGIGDVNVIVSYGSLLQETYELTDYIKIGFNGWTGTYTTGTDTYDYITPSTIISPNVSLPNAFKVTFKFKNMNNSQASTGSGLWNIGADTNNGILIGHEGTDRRIRAYIRTNGTNSAQTPQNNAYQYQTWTDAEITYQNGTISLSIGGKTISYNISAPNIMQTYEAYTMLRIAEFKIKAL